MAEENTNTKEKGSGISLKSVLIIGIVMIVLAGLTSYGLITFLTRTPGEEEDTIKDKNIGPSYSLGDYVVNLAGSGGYKYIRANIVVEIDNKDVIEELEKRDPQIRDAIIAILREQKLQDIEEPGAKVLKNRVISHLNNILTTGEIVSVWFTELVVQ